MIHIERPLPPPVFQSAELKREQSRLYDFYTKGAAKRSQSRFNFKFQHPEIRKALEDLFYGKCAFCETDYSAVSKMDVENFRPKGGAVGMDGKLSPDHYWWLTYEWFNLYSSCPQCNRCWW